MTASLPDQPIDSADLDFLGRTRFASAVADLILNAPPGASLRIGIYGGWGEGKTSVLNLIRVNLKKHVCVWLTPWLFQTRDEMAAGLLRAIAEELGIDIRSLSAAQSAKATSAPVRRAAATANIWFRLADALFGSAVETLADAAVREMTRRTMESIDAQLNGRKLVVFVDDVDRVNPNQVPGLLLMLREALDQPDYFYVLALAPEVVERGLQAVHESWGEPRQFLEKIVELPLYLPEPTAQQRSVYLEEMLRRVGAPSTELLPLRSISDLLPENPRRLKLFLRYICSLQSLLSRFSDDELDRVAFYVVQMLRIEFSEELRRFARDEDAIGDIEMSRARELADRMSAEGKSAEQGERVRRESTFIRADHPERERFLRLFSALRERGSTSWGGFGLRKVLAVTEEPPVFTFRELQEVGDRWTSTETASRQHVLVDAIGLNDCPERERVVALFRGLLDVRKSKLDAAASADLENDVRRFASDASSVLAAIRELSLNLRGFADGHLGTADWTALFHHAMSWAHFARLDYYARIRDEERALLRESFGVLSSGTKASIARLLEARFGTEADRAEEFIALVRELRDRAEVAAAEILVMDFQLPNGLQAFWTEKSQHPAKAFLFDSTSAFHREERFRNALREVARKAYENVDVQRNFVTYLQQLCYGASEGGSFPMDGCRSILQDHELLRTIWSGATARALNPRTAGDLRRYRKALVKWSVPAEVVPLPEWWQRLEADGFWKREDDSPSNEGRDSEQQDPMETKGTAGE